MESASQVEFRLKTAAQISTLIVLNIIWWMVMIAAIGLGATHLNRCPVQPYIPIFLIVMGASSILSLTITYTSTSCEGGCLSTSGQSCMAVLHLFSFCWFIAGSTWIYPVYSPDYTPGGTRFCDQTLYLFAFTVITLVWVTVALLITCCCCFALMTCCMTVIAGRRLVTPRYSFYGATSNYPEVAAGDV